MQGAGFEPAKALSQ